MKPRPALVLAVSLLACSSSSTAPSAGDDAGVDATVDAGIDAPLLDASDDVNRAATCASTFGSELTDAFGRIDGTILAVVAPSDTQCALPNSTHVVLQVTMHGAAYRMVVNVQSDRDGGDPRVQMLALDHAPPGDPWSEGWHPFVKLDYPSMLGVKSTDFVALDKDTLVQRVSRELELGAKISVYATSTGGASAHLIHRNGANTDGAIVVHPDSANARLLLFHFDEQVF